MTKFLLINSILAEEDGPEGEKPQGFLANFKKSFASAKGGKSAPQQKSKEPRHIDSKTSPLYTFASSVRGAPAGSQRVVLRTSLENLKTHYTKTGGGHDLVKNLTDTAVTDIAKSMMRGGGSSQSPVEIQALNGGYPLSDLAKGEKETVSLLNVPVELITGVTKAKDAASARAALEKLMNHDYYIMTLNTQKMKDRSGALDKAGNNLERIINALNPHAVVVIHPNSVELHQAKKEWDERYAAHTGSGEQHKSIEHEDEPKPEDQAPVGKKPGEEAPKQDQAQAPVGKKPGETAPAAAPAEEPAGSDIDATTATLAKAWDSFVGGVGADKDGKLGGKYRRLSSEQRIKLQQQLVKMLKAVGYDEDGLKGATK